MKHWQTHILNLLRKYAFASGVCLLTATLGITVIKMSLERQSAINTIKEQIIQLENSLLAAGMDIAYDHLSFSSISPWQVVRIKNLQIYSLDSQNFWEWKCDEFDISSDVFDANKLHLHFSQKQHFQLGEKLWEAELPQTLADVVLSENHQLKDIILQAENISVQNLFSIENLAFSAQRLNAAEAVADTVLEVKNVLISDKVSWPLSKKIEYIYLNSNIIGTFDSHSIFTESLYNWIEKDGFIKIAKLIVNWKPLVLVGKGDLFFDENLAPSLSMNTSSLALTEILDTLNQNGILQDKGVFVAKILLNNKSFKKNQSDAHYTVTTPIKFDKGQVLIENIPVFE